MSNNTTTRLFTFAGSATGEWLVDRIDCLVGAPIAPAGRLAVHAGPLLEIAQDVSWSLQGITSNDRYVERSEKVALAKRQAGMGRPECTRAALIPIRKSAAWWALTQDERRAIFEAQSQHIAIGMKYLPAVARRLHHCRDLGHGEPFDFLTWFDFAPSDEAAFDDLLQALRTSPEWAYVDREIDIRLEREAN
jgi:Chlorite dismutase